MNGNCVLGVDIGGTKIAMGIVDAQGRVRARDVMPVSSGGQVQRSGQVLARVRAFLRGQARVTPVAVGVSIAAALHRGTVLYAPNLVGWEGVALERDWSDALGCPVFAVYDGHAALLGEQWLGVARGRQDVVLIIVGTGVGGAFMDKGRLVEGRNHLAGLIGWLPMPAEAGNMVSLESRIAGPAIGQRLSALLGRPATSRELFQLAARRVPPARQLLQDVLRDLGVALAAVVSICNPEMIVLGGGLGTALAAYEKELRSVMTVWAPPVSAAQVPVAAAALGNDAGWIGAAHRAGQLGGTTDPGGVGRPRDGWVVP